MPAEQLDLLGGPPKPVPTGPPRVPSVTLYSQPFRRDCRREGLPCGHCQINAYRFRRGEVVAGWSAKGDMVILKSTVLITDRDGSTLSLCAQHAQEHDERGFRDA